MRKRQLGGLVTRVLDHLSSSLRLDWTLAGVVTLANLAVFLATRHANLLGWGTAADRVTFYVAADATIGIIVGFTITALAFFYTMDPGRRLQYVRHAGGVLLRRVWIGSLTAPLLSVGVLTLALLIDNPDVHSAGIRWVVEFLLIVTALRFGRLVWLFSKLLEVATEDTSDAPGSGRPLKVYGPRKHGGGKRHSLSVPS